MTDSFSPDIFSSALNTLVAESLPADLIDTLKSALAHAHTPRNKKAKSLLLTIIVSPSGPHMGRSHFSCHHLSHNQCLTVSQRLIDVVDYFYCSTEITRAI